jgi:hypothetical protein
MAITAVRASKGSGRGGVRSPRADAEKANAIIAKRIVELAGAGERNSDLRCQAAIEELRGHLCSD